jgi:hypothetical protein
MVPFSQRDYDRLGVEIIKEHKIAVECWDMTEMLNNKVWKQRKMEAFKFSGYIGVSSMGLIKKMCENIGDAIVIDLLGPGLTCNWVRRLIKKTSAKTCVSELGLTASDVFRGGGGRHKINLERMVIKFKVYGIFSFFKSAMAVVCEKRRPEVSYRLMSGTASLARQDSHLINAQKIWAHSFDYNSILPLRNQEICKDTIVFIDTGINGSNPDFSMFSVKRFVTKKKYHISMVRVFSILEKYFNASVIIAGHPKVNYEKEPYPFGQREVQTGKTAELIRDCKIVVSHGSTADSFAVLWRKPLLLITTNEIESSVQKGYLDAEADLLRTQPINADDCLDTVDWSSISQRPIVNYDNYRNKLIKKDGTPEKNSWMILIDFLKREKENHE